MPVHGVMTDTGSFRFPATTASVHRMVATLKEKGFCIQKYMIIFTIIFWKTDCVLSVMLCKQDGGIIRIQYSLHVYTKADLQRYNIKTGIPKDW